MANSLNLLRIAHAAHDNWKKAKAAGRRRKEREMWAQGARRCIGELTAWTMSVDGRWRNRFGDGSREATTPSRTLKTLLDDLFYWCPGAWSGSVHSLLDADQPYGVIVVNGERADDAKEWLRQWVRVTSANLGRTEGSTRLMLKPRKNFVQLLYKTPPQRTEVAHA